MERDAGRQDELEEGLGFVRTQVRTRTCHVLLNRFVKGRISSQTGSWRVSGQNLKVYRQTLQSSGEQRDECARVSGKISDAW